MLKKLTGQKADRRNYVIPFILSVKLGPKPGSRGGLFSVGELYDPCEDVLLITSPEA